MRKQFFWMYVKAILKIVIPIGIAVAVMPMLLEEELAVTITICCTMGLAGLIYVISGILTIKNGAGQASRYIREYAGGKESLEEEYKEAGEFGAVKIGKSHVFANASDGFYIVPFDRIENVFVRHEGANPAKGRRGYYYLYIRCDGIGGLDSMIKIYYVRETKAQEAENYLREAMEFLC